MDEKLLEMAWQAREHAYAPYSQFKVGAAIATTDGKMFSGCNVEVANYGCTLCAERTAIVKAVSEGALKPGGLKTICVATLTPVPTAPCGSCRQVIEEFAHPHARVLMSRQSGEIALNLSHAELLPYSFNSDALSDN